MIEHWKLLYLNGNKTIYSISNLGRIKDNKNKFVKLFIRKDVLNDDIDKYFCNLVINLKPNTLAVDKLVAYTFLKVPRDGLDIVHLDGNVLNNCIENLRFD